MPKATFIIIEQSYLIRKGLSSLIEKIPTTQVIQEIDNTDELIPEKDLDADFVIINPSLINKDLEKALRKDLETSQIILISDNHKEITSKIKYSEIIELNESQKSILKKLNNLIGAKVSKKSKLNKPEEISEREADIVRNIALGYSNKEIADRLFISTHTVVTHRKNITRKLGIKTVPGLTIYAILNKLIDIDETEQTIT